VVKYKLAEPFSLPFSFEEQNEQKITWSKSFTRFLKEPVAGLEKDGTNKFDLYSLSLLYKKAVPTKEQLETIAFSEDTPVAERILLVPIDWEPPPAPAAPAPLAGKKRDREEDDAGRKDKSQRQEGGGQERATLFTKNKDSPNFLLFFLLTYSPEFFALACAYELSARNDMRVLEKYKDVFNTTKTTALCAGYGKLDEEYLYEYSAIKESGSSQRTTLNSLCTHACAVLKAVLGHKTKEPRLLTLVKEKSPEIAWLTEHLNEYYTLPSVSLNMEDKMFHLDAACYYQQIFDADVNLCILNERRQKNPLDDVVLLKRESARASSRSASTKKIRGSSSKRLSRTGTRKIKSPRSVSIRV
jgi:hypothetical protein